MILGAGTYDRAMTATEVANHYAQINQVVSGGDGFGQAYSQLPWFWTKDGDNVLDWYDDSTHDNFGVAGGISGNVEAETEYYLTTSTANRSIIMCINDHDNFIKDTLFADEQNDVHAGALNGQSDDATVNTTPTANSDWQISITNQVSALENKPVWLLHTLIDDGTANLQGAVLCFVGAGGVTLISDYRSYTPHTATYKQFILGPVFIPKLSLTDYTSLPVIIFQVYLKRTTGSGAVSLDTTQVLVGKMAWLYVSGSYSVASLLVKGKTVKGFTSGNVINEIGVYRGGDPLDLVPGKLNHIYAFMGDDAGAVNYTSTVTFTKIFITPLWELL
jgi:hypothetical protein